MQTKFQVIKKNFFKDSSYNTISKKFNIEADDLIFKTIFKQEQNDLIISIELLDWSNKEQNYVPIESSDNKINFKESNDFNLKEFLLKYSYIAKKLLDYFSSLKYYWQFKELFYHFENPMIRFHYKLLNSFTADELKKIISNFDFSKPILNICLLESNKTINYHQLFLPHYFYGCYFCREEIEISVDLEESDYVTIEDAKGKISKEKLFEILNNTN